MKYLDRYPDYWSYHFVKMIQLQGYLMTWAL